MMNCLFLEHADPVFFCGAALRNSPIFILVLGLVSVFLRSVGSKDKHVLTIFMVGRGWKVHCCSVSTWTWLGISYACIFDHTSKRRFPYLLLSLSHIPTLPIICPHTVFSCRNCWFQNWGVVPVISEIHLPIWRAGREGERGWLLQNKQGNFSLSCATRRQVDLCPPES